MRCGILGPNSAAAPATVSGELVPQCHWGDPREGGDGRRPASQETCRQISRAPGGVPWRGWHRAPAVGRRACRSRTRAPDDADRSLGSTRVTLADTSGMTLDGEAQKRRVDGHLCLHHLPAAGRSGGLSAPGRGARATPPFARRKTPASPSSRCAASPIASAAAARCCGGPMRRRRPGPMCSAISMPPPTRRRWLRARSCWPDPTDGLMPWRGRPDALKRGLIARVPPFDFSEQRSNDRPRLRASHARSSPAFSAPARRR